MRGLVTNSVILYLSDGIYLKEKVRMAFLLLWRAWEPLGVHRALLRGPLAPSHFSQ